MYFSYAPHAHEYEYGIGNHHDWQVDTKNDIAAIDCLIFLVQEVCSSCYGFMTLARSRQIIVEGYERKGSRMRKS